MVRYPSTIGTPQTFGANYWTSESTICIPIDLPAISTDGIYQGVAIVSDLVTAPLGNHVVALPEFLTAITAHIKPD
jgi:hypothetical protein